MKVTICDCCGAKIENIESYELSGDLCSRRLLTVTLEAKFFNTTDKVNNKPDVCLHCKLKALFNAVQNRVDLHALVQTYYRG